MPDKLYNKILSAEQNMLKLELAEMRREAFRLDPQKDRDYFAERYRDFEICKTAFDYLTGIHWQTCFDRELVRIIDRLTDKGLFFKCLVEWLKSVPEMDSKEIRKVINGFSSYMKRMWPERFGFPFEQEEPFDLIVSDRVALSLRRFRSKICVANADAVFDKAMSIGLLTHILGFEQMREIYSTDALVIIDRLNFEGTLIYHTVKWIEEGGLSFLYVGESLASATARFADHVLTL